MTASSTARLAGRLLLALAVPLFLLAGIEIVLRFASFGVDPSFVVRDTADGETVWRDNPDTGLLWFAPGLARSPVPFAVPEKTNDLRIVILGESAAMGDPAPAFGMASFLEMVLKRRFPDASVDVINAAMTAIDSSVIVEIARDLAPLKPDFVITYMGNNEVVGPFGPDTDHTRTIRGETWYTRLTMKARSLRTGQLLRSVYHKLGKPGQAWRGLELFSEKAVNPGSPVLDQLRRRYRDNILEIEKAVLAAGAVPVFGTMATRVNWPPFAGDTSDDTAAAEKLEAEGQWTGAYYLYRQLLENDPRSAEWHYRTARTTMAMGDVPAGVAGYIRSRDLDRLRFRADSTLNNLIREQSGEKAVVVDLEAVFNRLWAQPDRYFWDHVHLTPEGNYVAAMTLAGELEPVLLLLGMVAKASYPSYDEARRALVYSEWDRLRLASVMHQRMLKPPINRVSYFPEIIGKLTETITNLRKAMSRRVLEGERDLLADEVSDRPRDFHLRSRLAEVHTELREYDEARTVRSAMLERWPHARSVLRQHGQDLVRTGRLEEGLALLEQGELPGGVPAASVVAHMEASSILAESGSGEAALDMINRALAIDPAYAKGYYNRGIIYGRMEKMDEAVSDFLKAVELDPSLGEAYNNLGVAELKREHPEQAEGWFRRALEQQPLLISAMRNMALVTMMRGDWQTAYTYSRMLTYLDPEYADISSTQTIRAGPAPEEKAND